MQDMATQKRFEALLEVVEEETMAMADRLSQIPESLQLRILSCLDARQAVQTSVLSKSWVSLWTRIPVLNFSSCGFDYFVLNALSRRSQSLLKLDKLTIKHVGEWGDEISQAVFDYAFSQGVEELEANILDVRSWPTGSSDSLTSLKFTSAGIAGCTFLEPRSSGSFKNLTSLHLKGVTIRDLDPFSGFPALEKLRLDFCPLTTEGNALNVHAPQLSEFSILYYYKQSVHRCEFMTPKLRYFDWQGSNFPQLTGSLPVLETVVIDYNDYCSHEKERILFDDMLMFFNPLHNATSLTLFSPVVHLLTLFPLNGSTPPFPNLKRLKLDLKAFRNPSIFQRACGSWMDLVEHVPGLKASLLPKSQGAKCSVVLHDGVRAVALEVLRTAIAKRKAIQ